MGIEPPSKKNKRPFGQMSNSHTEYDFTSDNRNYNHNCEDMDQSPIETQIRPLILLVLPN